MLALYLATFVSYIFRAELAVNHLFMREQIQIFTSCIALGVISK